MIVEYGQRIGAAPWLIISLSGFLSYHRRGIWWEEVPTTRKSADVTHIPLNKDWSSRKQVHFEFAEKIAPERNRWIERNSYFYAIDVRYMKFIIPEGKRVLDL